ncbi:MAG TPA: twin-arginine translocase TatA/TatE family subunit [Flavobacteriaceae bacterium]|jgi:sec-independent protein translocase protein TatA|nr:twin-arginine translocase TatA/TatE family subunit [Flavobacteriaceae bacterium]HEX5742544.1 twin-arginine translocase TatA/TatE family subunit [Flavobacteriaceae bacterium]
MFLFISTGEIAFILFMVVMLFGTDKLPEIARGLGKGMRQLRDATNDIKREINASANTDLNIDKVAKMKDEIQNAVKKEIDEITGPVKRKF